jgi:Flp pilus assembly pilin Flp
VRKRKSPTKKQKRNMTKTISNLLRNESGQDVAEYAVLLAVILAIALGTIHLIGSQASNVFSEIGSKIQ